MTDRAVSRGLVPISSNSNPSHLLTQPPFRHSRSEAESSKRIDQREPKYFDRASGDPFRIAARLVFGVGWVARGALYGARGNDTPRFNG
jgi:hypothetical protein